MPPFLSSPQDLVTTKAATRAGFVELILEKNRRATPFVAQARALRSALSGLANPRDLLQTTGIETNLTAAAGVSDKAKTHLSPEDRWEAISLLISQFLEPEGEGWRDELVFRFLLTRDDTLGGEMRNAIGGLGQRKLARALLATLQNGERPWHWRHTKLKKWSLGQAQNAGIENDLNGLSWQTGGQPRTLLFNLTPPKFSKNIDLCLTALEITSSTTEKQVRAALSRPETYLAFGELKSGFDPAGADEHWKTAQSALVRIRENYASQPATFFIGAAIVEGMAGEIWTQLQAGTLTCAANLNDENQLFGLCRWLINL